VLMVALVAAICSPLNESLPVQFGPHSSASRRTYADAESAVIAAGHPMIPTTPLSALLG